MIDAGSSDQTGVLAREHGAEVVTDLIRGYGRAYKTGFSLATGDIVATMDGDGTYPPEYIPWLASHLIYHQYDFVIGDRFTQRVGKGMSGVNLVGNLTLAIAAHMLFPTSFHDARCGNVVDLESGMWVFRREVLQRLQLESDGTTFSQEIKLRALLGKVRFGQVPIPYYQRLGTSKLRPLRDGTADLLWLVRERFRVR